MWCTRGGCSINNELACVQRSCLAPNVYGMFSACDAFLLCFIKYFDNVNNGQERFLKSWRMLLIFKS